MLRVRLQLRYVTCVSRRALQHASGAYSIDCTVDIVCMFHVRKGNRRENRLQNSKGNRLINVEINTAIRVT